MSMLFAEESESPMCGHVYAVACLIILEGGAIIHAERSNF